MAPLSIFGHFSQHLLINKQTVMNASQINTQWSECPLATLLYLMSEIH